MTDECGDSLVSWTDAEVPQTNNLGTLNPLAGGFSIQLGIGAPGGFPPGRRLLVGSGSGTPLVSPRLCGPDALEQVPPLA